MHIKKKIFFSIPLFLLFCSAIILFFADSFFFFKKYSQIQSKYLPNYRQLMEFRNEFDLKRILNNSLGGKYPNRINLYLSLNDISSFRNFYLDSINNQNYLDDRLNKWKSAKIETQLGDLQDIDIKVHGTSQSPMRNSIGHLSNLYYQLQKKISHDIPYDVNNLKLDNGGYAFKIRLKGNSINSQKRINFLAPNDDWAISTNALNKYIRSKNIITAYGGYFNLFINDIDLGLYLGTDNIGSESLKINYGIDNFALLKNYDFWDKAWNRPHVSPTMFTAFDIEQSGNLVSQEIGLNKLRELFFAISNSDTNKLEELINLNEIAKIFVITLLTGSFHPLAGDNIRYIYEPELKKFRFSYRLEGSPKKSNATFLEREVVFSDFDYKPHPIITSLLNHKDFMKHVKFEIKNLSKDYELIISSLEGELKDFKDVESISSKSNNLRLNNFNIDIEIIKQNLKQLEHISKADMHIKLSHDKLYKFNISEEYLKLFSTVEETELGKFNLKVLNDSNHNLSISSIIFCNGKELILKNPINIQPAIYHSDTGLIDSSNITEIEINEKCVRSLNARNLSNNTKVNSKNIHINYMISGDEV